MNYAAKILDDHDWLIEEKKLIRSDMSLRGKRFSKGMRE